MVDQFFFNQKSNQKKIIAKKSWKTVELEDGFVARGIPQELIGIEELTDYTLVKKNPRTGKISQVGVKKKKIKKSQINSSTGNNESFLPLNDPVKVEEKTEKEAKRKVTGKITSPVKEEVSLVLDNPANVKEKTVKKAKRKLKTEQVLPTDEATPKKKLKPVKKSKSVNSSPIQPVMTKEVLATKSLEEESEEPINKHFKGSEASYCATHHFIFYFILYFS